MLVVADSSPLIVLIDIGHIGVLPRLFGQVIIPPEIAGELYQSNRPQAVYDFIASRPTWLDSSGQKDPSKQLPVTKQALTQNTTVAICSSSPDRV